MAGTKTRKAIKRNSAKRRSVSAKQVQTNDSGHQILTSEMLTPTQQSIIPPKVEIDMGPRTENAVHTLTPQFLKIIWISMIFFLAVVLVWLVIFGIFAVNIFSFMQ